MARTVIPHPPDRYDPRVVGRRVYLTDGPDGLRHMPYRDLYEKYRKDQPALALIYGLEVGGWCPVNFMTHRSMSILRVE